MKFNGLKTETESGQTGFLNGGGDMGARIRAFDWSGTTLGEIAGWPQSLKTAVNIVLQSPVPMVMLWGQDGVMIYNDAYSVFAGGRHPFLLGSPVVEGWPEVADFNRNVMDKGLSGERLSYKEQRLTLYRNNVPEEGWMNLNYSPIMDESGKPAGVLAIVVEPTRQVIAEQARTESEERFRTMAESTEILIGVGDETGNASYFNKAWAELTGRPVADLLNFGWVDLIHPEDRQGFMDIYLQAFEKQAPFTGEFRVLNQTGEYRWLLAKAPPRFRPDGSFAGYISSCVDITKRKQVEEAYRQSEAKLTAILNQLVEGVIITDTSGAIAFVNESAAKLHRVTRLDVTPEKYSDTYHLFTEDGQPYPPEDLPLARAVLRDETVLEARWRIRRPDKTEILAIGSARPVYGPEGSKIGAVLTLRDDTEREATTQALRESETQFRTMASSIPQLAWMAAPDGGIFWYNDRWYGYTGTTLEEMEGAGWKKAIHPNQANRVVENFDRAFKTGESWKDTFPLRGGDGEYRWFLSQASPLKDETGQIVRWFGTNTDITDQLEIKAALQHSETRLKKYTHQQDVIAEFSLQAITGVDNLSEITKIAVKMVAETLGIGYSKIIQRVPGTKNTLHILAVQGFPQDLVGKVFDPGAEPHSGYTLEALEPVVVDDLREEKRFIPSPILLANGMISGASVVIYAEGKPFGVLEVDSQEKRHFTDAEVNFLQTAATLIGTVVERKHGEEALAQQHELMRTITDTASACLFMIDQEGLVTFLNPAAMEVTGYWPEDAIGKSMHLLVHHSHPDGSPYPEADCPLVETYRDGKPNPSREDFFFRKDGSMFPALITGTPIQDINGLILGTVVEFRDITVEKRSQRLIENYTERLEASNRDLSQFASIVSHDLQAPLRKVMLFSDIISQQEVDRLSEDGKNHIRRMQGSVVRMQALIRDLLSLSRIDRGGSAFKKTDLNQVVAKVLDDLALSVKETNAQVNIGDLSILEADEQQMGQLFSNLIGNALKYRREGIAPHIEISCKKTDAGFVQLTIADNGIGINHEHYGKIFEIFQRLHNESKYSGTGIGLAIVKRIVDRHKGVILVESAPGEGTRFIIKLPVKQ